MRKVTRVGNIGFQGKQIQLGRRWAHARVRVIPIGGLHHIYYAEELLRVLHLDPETYNYPLGKKPGKRGAVS